MNNAENDAKKPDLLNENWVIIYTLNGNEITARIYDYNELPKIIDVLRAMGCINIIIKDETPDYVIKFKSLNECSCNKCNKVN